MSPWQGCDIERAVINNFSLYLALRYMRPKRTFVSVITLISIAGVALGVAVLIIVISVMAGFHAQIKELSVKFDSHIELNDAWGTSMYAEAVKPEGAIEKTWEDVMEETAKLDGVTSVSPVVKGLTLIDAGNSIAPTFMLGVSDDDKNGLIRKYKDLIVSDNKSPDLSGDNIVIDQRLARIWDLEEGDTIRLFAPSNLRDIVQVMKDLDGKSEEEKQAAYQEVKELSLPVELTITGIFAPPRLQDMSDITLVVVPLHIAQELYNMEGGISMLGVELADPYRAGEIKQKLVGTIDQQGLLPQNWGGSTWIEQHQMLFDTVQNELEMMYFILFIIVIVAAFCVMNTMITVTVQKRREIGIIAALGSRATQIIWVFLSQGMIVGAVGSLVGLGLGVLVVQYRNVIREFIAQTMGREIFSQEIYGLVEIPARIVPHDVGIICAGAFVLCTIAALLPAFLAARIEPAVALRD